MQASAANLLHSDSEQLSYDNEAAANFTEGRLSVPHR